MSGGSIMKYILAMLLFVIFFTSACSNQGNEDAVTDSDQESSRSATSGESYQMSFDDDAAISEADFAENVESESDSSDMSSEQLEQANENRKVIYTADLQVETDNYSSTLESIQAETTKLGGYIVESTMYSESEENFTSGQIIVRIPQADFDSFIEVVKSASNKVIEHHVSGQDVTEEFVDLESRLKSKRTVEERLLEFMENAEGTEDLLAISKNLSSVQEEIEVIVGRMNYLQNKADFATVSIAIDENNVTLSSISDTEQNTWEETKKQFKRSINFIITTFSSLVIFIGGNLPVFVLVGLLLLTGYFIIRKRINKASNKNNPPME